MHAIKLVAFTLLSTVLLSSAARASNLEQAIDEQAKTRAAGAVRVGQLYQAEATKRGDRTDWHVQLDPSKCYWFSGVGQGKIKALSLFLFTPDETAFTGRAADARSKTPEVVMMHCPEQSGMYRLQAKVTEGGAGTYGVGVYAKDAPKKVEKVVEPEKDLLGPEVEKLAKSAAPGATRVGELYESDAEIADWYAELAKGDCYWIIGVGEENIDELFIYLWDPADKRITQSRAKDRRATVGHCAKESGMYHIQVKVNDGSGKYKVGVYAKKKS